MRAKRKRPGEEPALLPGVEAAVVVGRDVYRVEVDDIKQVAIDAVMGGRGDLEKFSREQFGLLMRVLVTLRIRAFALPFDTFGGGACSVVRRHLKAVRPSEMARAIVGAGRDPFWRTKKPTLAAILARTAELQSLADDAAPPPPRLRNDVMHDFVRLYPIAYECDWTQRWPDPIDAERCTVPILEMHLTAMRKAIESSRRMTAEQKHAALRG